MADVLPPLPLSRVVNDLAEIDYRDIRDPIFVVYDHPIDFPDKFAVRLFDGAQPTNIVLLADTLKAARAAVPGHFLRVTRQASDEPHIVETYI